MWVTKKLTRFLNLSQFFSVSFFGFGLVLFENCHGSMRYSQNAFRRGNPLRDNKISQTARKIRRAIREITLSSGS